MDITIFLFIETMKKYQISKLNDVADTEKGNEVTDIVGKKVRVKGFVVDDGGAPVITVNSYVVIEE